MRHREQPFVPRLRLHAWLSKIVLVLLLSSGIQGSSASAQTVYFHNDVTGSPVAATDEGGNLLWRESYRPYGERILKPATKNSHWFHGKELDSESGMLDFGARNYDPVLGRFLSIDPVDFEEKNIHSFNRYAYGNNNPLKYKDPDGRNPIVAVVLRMLAVGLTVQGLGEEVSMPGGSVAGAGAKGTAGAAGNAATRNAATEVTAAAQAVPAELKPYAGKGGGHHVPAKSAFKGAENYDPRKALAMPNAEMARLNVSHSAVTGAQASLYQAFAKTGADLTWEAMEKIETQALIAARMDPAMASATVKQAIQELQRAGVPGPTRIPWSR